MLPRLVLVLVPFLAAATGGFALMHAYGAVVAVRKGSAFMALLYALLSIAGVVLSLAIRRIRKQYLRRPA